jgi:hypothetical protein
MEWIKTEDQLPALTQDKGKHKKSDNILCYFEDGDMEIMTYEEGVFNEEEWSVWSFHNIDITADLIPTHWMPLPSAPKPQKQS